MQSKNIWNPYKSKWKAALEKRLDVKINGNENILYLGASSGSTVSKISPLTKGLIFAVENSPKMAIRLVKLTQKLENVAPIFSDARDIDYIKKMMFNKKIEILFQDIPSTDQSEILTNAARLVDKDCKILFSLKTQSISQQNPNSTMLEIKKKLEKNFKIIDVKPLQPFHKKHFFFVLKKL